MFSSSDDIPDYGSFLLEFLMEAKRILKGDGTLWMFCARTMIPTAFKAIEEAGLRCNLENWMTWARQKGRSGSKHLKSQAEEVLHITKTGKYVFNKVEYLREVVAPYVVDGKPRGWFLDQNTGMRVRWTGIGNVLAFSSPTYHSRAERQIHSTQKPVLLNAELIMLSSRPGETVFDPFSGSGSCAVAAEITGRNFVGCEKDKSMYEKSLDWLDNLNYEEFKNYIDSRVKIG